MRLGMQEMMMHIKPSSKADDEAEDVIGWL